MLVAEIRVVREKRGGMGWLWAVLLLLALAAVAYWLWSTGRLADLTGRADMAPANAPAPAQPAPAQPAPTSSIRTLDARLAA
jgi:hypothetical protein